MGLSCPLLESLQQCDHIPVQPKRKNRLSSHHLTFSHRMLCLGPTPGPDCWREGAFLSVPAFLFPFPPPADEDPSFLTPALRDRLA